MKKSDHMGLASRRVGLARALSKLGYCSRSRAAALICEGRVRLNGSIARDPETPVRLGRDRIDVDDRGIESQEKIYLMLNKPRGVVTTASDEKDRDTIYSCLRLNEQLNEMKDSSGTMSWLAPVGRLDKATEGLLLLTNDSEWGARVTDPDTHLNKTYHVQINVLADEAFVASLKKGTRMADGELLGAVKVSILRKGTRNSWLEIVLDEGKNRQIRRMLEQHGVEVLRLVRVSVGPLQLGNLMKGVYRPLSIEEKHSLDREMSEREPRLTNRE